MTGFGRGSCQEGDLTLRVEVRSVNSRNLDVKVRTPWNDSQLESRVVGLVRGKLSRGRVELAVVQEADSTAATKLRLSRPVAQALGHIIRELADAAGCDESTAARLLPPVPELLEGQNATLDADALWNGLSGALEQALAQLSTMREREGAALREDLTLHLDQLQHLVVSWAETARTQPARIRQRLEARLAQLLDGSKVPIDSTRLAQEAALLAERSDTSEELARLGSHIEHLREMLEKTEPIGRRIEFILQEMHRELNTLSSKIGDAAISAAVVEGKAAVERMREQAQNVE